MAEEKNDDIVHTTLQESTRTIRYVLPGLVFLIELCILLSLSRGTPAEIIDSLRLELMSQFSSTKPDKSSLEVSFSLFGTAKSEKSAKDDGAGALSAIGLALGVLVASGAIGFATSSLHQFALNIASHPGLKRFRKHCFCYLIASEGMVLLCMSPGGKEAVTIGTVVVCILFLLAFYPTVDYESVLTQLHSRSKVLALEYEPSRLTASERWVCFTAVWWGAIGKSHVIKSLTPRMESMFHLAHSMGACFVGCIIAAVIATTTFVSYGNEMAPIDRIVWWCLFLAVAIGAHYFSVQHTIRQAVQLGSAGLWLALTQSDRVTRVCNETKPGTEPQAICVHVRFDRSCRCEPNGSSAAANAGPAGEAPPPQTEGAAS